MKPDITVQAPAELFLQEEMQFKGNDPSITLKKDSIFNIKASTKKNFLKAENSIRNIETVYQKIKCLKS